jgi:hypothetical protein
MAGDVAQVVQQRALGSNLRTTKNKKFHSYVVLEKEVIVKI